MYMIYINQITSLNMSKYGRHATIELLGITLNKLFHVPFIDSLLPSHGVPF